MLVELGLKTFEQGKRVRRAPGEAGDHAPLMQSAHLAGIALEDLVSHGDLAVAAYGYMARAPHG